MEQTARGKRNRDRDMNGRRTERMEGRNRATRANGGRSNEGKETNGRQYIRGREI